MDSRHIERRTARAAASTSARQSTTPPAITAPDALGDRAPARHARRWRCRRRAHRADAVHIAFHHPPRAGLLFNLDTGQVLWQRDPYTRLRIASLTKMMTALLDRQVRAARRARVLVTKAGRRRGRLEGRRAARSASTCAWRRMLYGLMLPSGNDAADRARPARRRQRQRVRRRSMNDEAAKLGLGCTRYSSPSGYFDAGNFSCAADLAVLAHVDLAQPRIARIVAHPLGRAAASRSRAASSTCTTTTRCLIYDYPGQTGLKTGYTDAAGRCLVATAERDGVRLGVVVLNSPDPATPGANSCSTAASRASTTRRPWPSRRSPPAPERRARRDTLRPREYRSCFT